MQTFGNPPNVPIQVMEPKKVREVHAMVRNHLNKEDDVQPSSFGNWLCFASLLEQNLEGKFLGRTNPLKLKVLDFQKDLFQSIWSPFGQPSKLKIETVHYRVKSSTVRIKGLFG